MGLSPLDTLWVPSAPPSIYLFIYNLGRFRDLRKEDDYGFGSAEEGKPAGPGRQFAMLLREGPTLGIHTLAWSDSYSTIGRLLDRQSLRDFEMRVLFQMNATDSSSLMDAPDASRLGLHRAIFYDEGRGHMEKFRPYGLPTAEWLEAAWAGNCTPAGPDLAPCVPLPCASASSEAVWPPPFPAKRPGGTVENSPARAPREAWSSLGNWAA